MNVGLLEEEEVKMRMCCCLKRRRNNYVPVIEWWKCVKVIIEKFIFFIKKGYRRVRKEGEMYEWWQKKLK